MRVLLATTLVAFSAFFFQVVRCGDNMHNSPWAKRHHPRVALADDVVATQHNITSLGKRIEGAKFTFYDAGLGACGAVNSASDFIVALNAAQFDGGSHCHQTITITVNGKTTQAQITDMCVGCPYGGLDFTRGLFDFFASEAAGILSGSWNFGGAVAPSPTPTPTPTPTPKPQPPPSTSIVTPTSTSTPPPPPTSTQTRTSSVSTSQAHSTSSTSTSASIPTPTPLIPPPAGGNIAGLFQIFIQFGSITATGHGKTSPK